MTQMAEDQTDQHAVCECGCCGPATDAATATMEGEPGRTACGCSCGCAGDSGCSCGCAEAACTCGCATS